MLMLPELPLFTVPVKRTQLPEPPADSELSVIRDMEPDEPGAFFFLPVAGIGLRFGSVDQRGGYGWHDCELSDSS